MTIKKYAGDKVTGLSSDVKPTNMPDGATFYETDTLKVYVRASSAWTQTNANTANTATYLGAANNTGNSTGVYVDGLVRVGNSTVNVFANTTAFVGNLVATTITGNLSGNVIATTISGNLTGNVVATTVNTTSINATSNIVVGANVLVNTSVLQIGNSTAFVYVNSTAYVGNVVATTISGNLTGNVVATTISGNLTGNVVATNVNTSTLQISTSATLDNDKALNFKTKNTAATARFVQQSDDNFVFYSTDAAYAQRAIWAVYANSSTSPMNILAPVTFSGANVNIGTAAFYANGSPGTLNQILTSNGSATFWSSPGAASVNTAAAYTWTNNHTFNANVTMTYAYFSNNNGQVNASGGDFKSTAYAWLSGAGSNYLAFGQQSNFAQWIQSGYSAVGSTTYYPIILNPLGGNIGIGNTTPSHKLRVEGDVSLTGGISVNSSFGTASQVLTSNGTGAYWSTLTPASVNVAAQYAWTNTHTFAANVSITANALGLASNSSAIYLAGVTDPNWKIGRNTGAVAKWVYSNNTLDLVAANSNLEGVVIGFTGNSYLETGHLGTFVRDTLKVGNSTVNVSVNATAFIGNVVATNVSAMTVTANVVAQTISGNLTGNVVATNISGNLSGNVLATTVNATTINATANIVVGANVLVNTSVLQIGNSTAFVYVNSTAFVGNVVATSISGNLTGNVAATTISGNLTGNVAATILSGNLTAITANVTNKIQVGTPGAFDFGSNAVIEIDANGNSYVQVVVQNANTGNNASADLVVTADTGNDSVDFVDLGINNSLYNQPGFNIVGAKDAYLYASNGHLAIGTASAKEVIFHANGTTSTNRVMTINATAVTIANAATLVANSSAGSAGQVLTSNSTGVYWSTVSSSVNVAAQYAWTNTHTFTANVTFGNTTVNNAFLTSYFGVSNPNTFTMGTITTTAGINTVLAGPYTIATGNSIVIATNSRLVIV